MATQTRQLAALLRDEGVAVDLIQINTPYRPAWVARFRGVRALFRLIPYLLCLRRAMGRNDVMHLMANSGWSWHLFAMPAVLVAKACGLPTVINYRGGKAKEFLRRQHRWVVPVLKAADVLAVPSAFLEGVFQPFGLQTTIVPNIVDLSRFDNGDSYRDDLTSAPHLVVTRNLETIYDIPTALEAFAHVRESKPEARLTVAGIGPQRDSLVNKARRLHLGDSVRFAGGLERKEMALLYSSAHIMLNPSRVDNTPNAILEAWASGAAVISTNVGGVPHLVKNGEDAILVPPGCPRAMADVVLSVLESRERWNALRLAGRRAADQCSWEHVGEVWLEIYRDLAARKDTCRKRVP